MSPRWLWFSLIGAVLALAISNIINIGILRSHIRTGDELIAADRRLKAANDHLLRADEKLRQRTSELMLANERLRSACGFDALELTFRP
jgi:hypothetical protein